MPQIRTAGPIARRRAIIALIAVAVAGALAYLWLEQWLGNLETSDPDVARAALAGALLWASCAMALIIAALRRAERFPPPGAKVTRDTPVVTGSAARTRGLLLQVIAGVLLGCAVVLLAMAWRLATYAG